MFTGIIEATGKVIALKKEQQNLHITLSCPFINELKIDQSLAHNGVCLTIIDISENSYTVTAIKETLEKTNLGSLKVGQFVNLERAMPANGRFDGHVVQGHIDQIAICTEVTSLHGSWMFSFEYEPKEHITVEKGSITINGVSLTVVDSFQNRFSVCIIPYTHANTTFKFLQKDGVVNLEFDIIGKYVSALLKNQAITDYKKH
ncbi:MAG: riboflavin synthase [Flavobacteriales bacterium]|nr:riboflavin synthase [Flavobacteriales bacterium]